MIKKRVFKDFDLCCASATVLVGSIVFALKLTSSCVSV